MSATQNKETIYYFSIDYKATKKAIKHHVDEYNNALKQLWNKGDGKKEFEAKHGKGMTYGKMCFKSGEETTVWMALDLLAGFIQQNAIQGDIDDDFRISNKALCTKKHDRMVKSTAYRHVKKALAAGIFVSKKFNGTKTGFSISWNKSLLRFNQNFDFNTMLAERYKALLATEGIEASINHLKGLFNLKPKGCDLLGLGYSNASCNLNYTTILLLEHKINIKSGIVNCDYPSSRMDSLINNNFLDLSLNNECHKGIQNTPPIAPAPPAPPEIVKMEQKSEAVAAKIDKVEKLGSSVHKNGNPEELFWHHVMRVYAFAISTLYPDRVIHETERNLGCLQIYYQFKKATQNSKAQDINSALLIHASDFMSRILLTKKFLNKNPFFNQPKPQVYFDVDGSFGFNRTAEWLKKTNEMRAKNTEYLSHYKLLISCYNDYSKNPCVKTYQSANARLSKLKNDTWKNYFNECVANLKQLDKKGINRIWKTDYRATA